MPLQFASQPRSAVWEILRAYYQQCGPAKRLIPVLLLLLFVDAAIQAAIPALMGYIVNALVTDARAFVAQQLSWLVLAAAVTSLIFYGVAYSQHYLTQRIGQEVGIRFQVELYNHLQRLSADFYQRNHVGEITARLTNDIGAGVMPLFSQFMITFWALSVLLVSFVSMAYISKSLLLALLLVTLAMAVVTRIVGRHLQQLTREVRDEAGRINARMTETISANPLIRAFAREAAVTQDIREHTAIYLHKMLRTTKVSVLFSDVMNTVMVMLAPMTLLLIGAFFVGRGITVGALVAAFGYWKTAAGPIGAILGNVTTLFTSFASMDRIFEFFHETPSVQDQPDAAPLTVSQGEIELRDVTFRYPAGEERPVLDHLSLRIPGKHSLALVGESGAGKSTIVQLLLRFYDPVSGQVCIDGQELRAVTQESLRNQIGYVMQETILLSGTIRDNLLLAKPQATTEEMIDALRFAEAWDFVCALPNGLDTMLGERGARLSTGQKQRISIARVFLKNPPIVIFDEATSSLDAITEKQIQQTMQKLFTGRTAVLIAHRLSTIVNCDRILLLDHGKIVAHGTHAELLAASPRYRELCAKQMVQMAA